jgi:hypothetical protein
MKHPVEKVTPLRSFVCLALKRAACSRFVAFFILICHSEPPRQNGHRTMASGRSLYPALVCLGPNRTLALPLIVLASA